MKRFACVGFVLVLALGLGTEAFAQRPPIIIAPRTQTPPAPAPAPRAPVRPVPRARAPAEPAPRPIAPGVFGLATMAGWTALTDTPVATGATVVRLGSGEGRIITRSANDRLRIASINLSSPGGPIADSAWGEATSGTVLSEPHCERLAPSSATLGQARYDMLCGYLGPNGSAVIDHVTLNGLGSSPTNLGGSNAGFRPTIVPDPVSHVRLDGVTPVHRDEGYGRLVWDGGLASFRRDERSRSLYGTISNGAFGRASQGWKPAVSTASWPAGWTAMKGAYLSPYGCVRANEVLCASGVGGIVPSSRRVRIVSAEPNADDFAATPVERRLTNPVPGVLSFNIPPVLVRLDSGAVVVIARGQDGRIYREGPDGVWIDEGGATRDGSGVSCVADGAAPVCFVHGSDGRLYWKRLG